ncbi:MAG: hypothetical protein WA071_12350 [Undibacterium umbellatum]|uniref:hypothetical protein n=1 Tax=Undibacterium umbellatum TaxID=2762300 RepID=UPI003BB5C7BD
MYITKYAVLLGAFGILTGRTVIAVNSDDSTFSQVRIDKQSNAANQESIKSSQPQIVETLMNDSKSANCENPVGWQEAEKYAGKTITLVGPVQRVTIREDIRGKPIWIDIGAVFPNKSRVTLIIWDETKSNFPMVKPGHLENKNVCVVGTIEMYRGSPQIVMRTANQFNVLPVVQSRVKLGYLKETIKENADMRDFVTCSYRLQSDYLSVGWKSRPIANYVNGKIGKGLAFNIDDQDVLVRGRYEKNGAFAGSIVGRKVLIPVGKEKSCGDLCSEEWTTIDIFDKAEIVNSVKVVNYCNGY